MIYTKLRLTQLVEYLTVNQKVAGSKPATKREMLFIIDNINNKNNKLLFIIFLLLLFFCCCFRRFSCNSIFS